PESRTPTRRRPARRAWAAFAFAAARPFAWGSETSTIVQPRRPRGQTIEAGFAGGFGVVVGFGAVVGGFVAVVAGSVGSGAVSVEPSFVTVRLPPVAVEMALGSSPLLEIAIAAPAPRTAITRPTSAGKTHGA